MQMQVVIEGIAEEVHRMNVGLLLRIVGMVMIAYGAQKLFDWQGGPGFAGFRGMMRHMNLQRGKFWVTIAALNEFGGLMMADQPLRSAPPRSGSRCSDPFGSTISAPNRP